jgi:hypothetical protein
LGGKVQSITKCLYVSATPSEKEKLRKISVLKEKQDPYNIYPVWWFNSSDILEDNRIKVQEHNTSISNIPLTGIHNGDLSEMSMPSTPTTTKAVEPSTSKNKKKTISHTKGKKR